MIKIKTNERTAIIAALLLSVASISHAAPVSVFLDNGSTVPDSSNTVIPPYHAGYDTVWDVAATAESGLSGIGAAVMEVRMIGYNVNGNVRRTWDATNGLGVETGATAFWMDGSTREGVLFQLAFYSDLAKTTEITDLEITFNSMTARIGQTYSGVDAFAGSGAVNISSLDNTGTLTVGGTLMHAANGGAMSFASQLGIVDPAAASVHHTIASAGSITFTENDSFWLRRRDIDVGGDALFQLGAVTFDVVISSVPAPPIGDITVDQLLGTNGLALTWDTASWGDYSLLSKSNLLDESWSTNIAGIPGGTNGFLTVTTAVDQAQSFYRVIGE